jgi:hypothetical protein
MVNIQRMRLMLSSEVVFFNIQSENALVAGPARVWALAISTEPKIETAIVATKTKNFIDKP